MSSDPSEIWGIVVAAGTGTRFGAPKQFSRVHGRRLVDHVVELMTSHCHGVVLVLPEGHPWTGPPVAAVVVGGASRSSSVRAALAAVPMSADIVVVHDPAHPLAPAELFEAVIDAVRSGADAAAPALPLDEPIKRVDARGEVTETIERTGAQVIQTPHAFRASALRTAHTGDPDAAEDTELVKRRGGKVVVVRGDARNLHVTNPEHLELVARLAVPSWDAAPRATPTGNNDAVRAEARADGPDLGTELHDLCAELFPICRSITGDGVRATLDLIGDHLPLEIHEVPSGTVALDWTVPPEWNIRDAYVRNDAGERLIDFQRSNLHVVGYSTPVHERLSFDELRPHLFTLPDRPRSVPYRTSYYNESWGFCLAHDDLDRLQGDSFEVVIDSTLAPGSLTYGECFVRGETTDEVLVSTHVCHPSLANDNTSGVALVTFLGRELERRALRYSYRLLFIPGTIGSIVWLARNEARLDRIAHGLVVTGVGDRGPLTYKRSRRGTADVDRAAACVLRDRGGPHVVIDFSPYGYDERQFCSPGFDLPVGRIGRTPHGEYPEYHTSADDLDFIDPTQLADALTSVLDLVDVLEGNRRYRNTNPKGEPQLGRRGLYRSIGATIDRAAAEMALLWVLNLSDGAHDLLAVAERSGLPFRAVRHAADALLEHGLLEPLP
jgi:2-C-methyl-D-erythritol 4-phosphate cytidylyltransferase